MNERQCTVRGSDRDRFIVPCWAYSPKISYPGVTLNGMTLNSATLLNLMKMHP